MATKKAAKRTAGGPPGTTAAPAAGTIWQEIHVPLDDGRILSMQLRLSPAVPTERGRKPSRKEAQARLAALNALPAPPMINKPAIVKGVTLSGD